MAAAVGASSGDQLQAMMSIKNATELAKINAEKEIALARLAADEKQKQRDHEMSLKDHEISMKREEREVENSQMMKAIMMKLLNQEANK